MRERSMTFPIWDIPLSRYGQEQSSEEELDISLVRVIWTEEEEERLRKTIDREYHAYKGNKCCEPSYLEMGIRQFVIYTSETQEDGSVKTFNISDIENLRYKGVPIRIDRTLNWTSFKDNNRDELRKGLAMIMREERSKNE